VGGSTCSNAKRCAGNQTFHVSFCDAKFIIYCMYIYIFIMCLFIFDAFVIYQFQQHSTHSRVVLTTNKS
jgi:hypothetical protein